MKSLTVRHLDFILLLLLFNLAECPQCLQISLRRQGYTTRGRLMANLSQLLLTVDIAVLTAVPGHFQEDLFTSARNPKDRDESERVTRKPR